MGTIIHKTVIVTGPCSLTDEESLYDVHNFAMGLYPTITSPIIRHITNGEATFMIASSGSKLGWDPANYHNDFIRDLLAFAEGMGVSIHVIEHGECTPKLVDS